MAPPPAANSSSRRMRRTRDAAVGVESTNDAFSYTTLDLYDVQGDAAAALPAWNDSNADDSSSSTSLTWNYNQLVLNYLVNGMEGGDKSRQSKEALLKQLASMDEAEATKAANEAGKRSTGSASKNLKRQRNDWIRAYNRALVLFSAGETREAASIGVDLIGKLIEEKTLPDDATEELAIVASRLAFLLLECILALSMGVHSDSQVETTLGTPPVSKILEWLEWLDSSTSSPSDSSKKSSDPQLKFLLALYKSRVDVGELDEAGNKHVDAKVRSARKELKTAMEVFQHKLRSSFGADTALSVVSSTNSEENSSSQHGQPSSSNEPQPSQPSSTVLQKYNQSALNLKANLEQLKGNTKKSLILCSEAAGAAVEDSYYDVVHANNLGVVYETNKKLHLALHSLAKGLLPPTDASGNNKSASPPLFAPDGTARPDPTGWVLYNAAICSLQARQYRSAYECMAGCVAGYSVFFHRPRCWLHMAQACIGIYSGLKVNNGSNKFSVVEAEGEASGLVLNNLFCNDSPTITQEDLVQVLGSAEDLEQVKRNPLLRARASLEHAISMPDELGVDALMSARLTLSYILLASHDYRAALVEAKLVLDCPEPVEGAGGMARRLYHRRLATARLYAAEASCALNETADAMKFLVGDGQEDAFDRLATDLSGVTLETASGSMQGKRRLANAQSVVRSSASVASTAMGNLAAAKKLAMSAQAMEDACSPNRERSAARRALVYCLLRGGNHGAALTIMQSLR